MNLRDYLVQSVVAIAIPVLAYVAGLAYLSQYLAFFGVSVNEFDIPLFTVLSYSVAALPFSWIIFVLIAAVAFLALLQLAARSWLSRRLYAFSSSVRALGQGHALLYSVALYILVLAAVIFSANERGSSDARRAARSGGVIAMPANPAFYAGSSGEVGMRPLVYLRECISRRLLRLIFATTDKSLSICKAPDDADTSVFLISAGNELLSYRFVRTVKVKEEQT